MPKLAQPFSKLLFECQPITEDCSFFGFLCCLKYNREQNQANLVAQ